MSYFSPRWLYLGLGCSLGLISAAACSAGKGSSLGDDDGGSNSGGAGAGMGTGGIMLGTGGSNTTSTSGNNCVTDPAVDDDMDGFTDQQGDCNDCDPNTNPGAIEVVTDPADPMAEPADENCDGSVDEVVATCDAGIDVADGDPMAGARAIGLCQTADPTGAGWGVLSAQYVRANGSPASAGLPVGIVDTFGPNVPPRRGDRMLVLSSGYARTPAHSGNCGDNSCDTNGIGTPPPGFPQDTPGCAGETEINDDVGLEVTVRSPTNASGYSFDFNFYSFEYPEWVCTSFNDQFIALVSPPPQGSINGNISFDSMSNPVSVNIAFFEVCSGCPLGTNELNGTGFDGAWGDDAGATSWLITQAPVNGGEDVTIRWAIWDTGDTAWDSTVLVDNFVWVADSGEPIGVGTTPVPK
jgi:hypothetical protein